MNWLLDRLAHVLVWVCGSVGPKELSGPSSPKSDHQQGAPADATLPATPHLDAHQLDKDALWRMFNERREAERQAKLQGFLSDLFDPKMDPFLHSWEPSKTTPRVQWSMADQCLWHETYAAFLLGPVEPEPPREFGETNGQD